MLPIREGLHQSPSVKSCAKDTASLQSYRPQGAVLISCLTYPTGQPKIEYIDTRTHTYIYIYLFPGAKLREKIGRSAIFKMHRQGGKKRKVFLFFCFVSYIKELESRIQMIFLSILHMKSSGDGLPWFSWNADIKNGKKMGP